MFKIIEVTNLQFRYAGATEDTVKGISFKVAEGEIFGFLGPSGAGKSTTQKILTRMLQNYSGTVAIMKLELKKATASFYEHIGVGFELPNLYSRFTALENLNFFSKLYSMPTEEPMKLLAMVGLEQEAKTRVSEFSKGMKMRLNFCRALLNKPKILFLDEPTSGLDPKNARIIQDLIINQKRQGTTIFLTTHNMNIAECFTGQNAVSTVMLSKGRRNDGF